VFTQLYAYAKVAEGKDFSKAEKPGMFNLAVRLHSCTPHDSSSIPAQSSRRWHRIKTSSTRTPR
jgi:hypothetical protein